MNDQTGYDATIQMPEGASTFAQHVDSLYYDIFWISVVFFVAIVGCLVVFAYKFRRRQGVKAKPPTGGQPALWILGALVPIFALGYIFHQGIGDFLTMSTPPANAVGIRVVATQWSWNFVYSSGREDPELTVPVNQPVRLTLTSASAGDHPAVLHSFFAPALRINRGIVPGHESTIWFEATELGDHPILCGEYCGVADEGEEGHASMLSQVHVVSAEDYAAFDNMGIPARFEGDYVAWGRDTFEGSCTACHRIDDSGESGVGPNLHNVVGYEQPLTEGAPRMADLAYMRESLREPGAAIVAEFTNGMPSFASQFNDEKIDAIIEYLASESDRGTAVTEELVAGRE